MISIKAGFSQKFLVEVFSFISLNEDVSYFPLVPKPCQYHTSSQFMLLLNITQFSLMFYLISFPGLEAIEHWIFIVFFLMYLVAIPGNSFILIIIKINSHLHTPMYYLLSFLAVIDWDCQYSLCLVVWESFGSTPMATLKPSKSRCSASTHVLLWSPQCSLSCSLTALCPSVIP